MSNLDWISAHAAELQAAYPGEWIAVADEQVIAHGYILDVMAAARAQGKKETAYYEFIPLPDEDSAPMVGGIA